MLDVSEYYKPIDSLLYEFPKVSLRARIVEILFGN